MKKFTPVLLIFVLLTSCSVNRFQVRKNFHSRISVDVNREHPNMYSDDFAKQVIPADTSLATIKNERVMKPKEGIYTRIMDKLADHFVPKKKELLRPILHPVKHKLTKSNSTKDERVAGLIVNILAIVFAVTALLMIIGVAHGSVWIYFTIGMVFAAAAIIMGFIGKHMAWKGFGIIAGILGIIAAVGLIIFMLLVTVVHVTF